MSHETEANSSAKAPSLRRALRAWSSRGGPGVVPEAAELAARIEALVGSDARASRHFGENEEKVLNPPHATPSCKFRGETIRAYDYRPPRDKDVGPDDPDLLRFFYISRLRGD